MISARMIAPRRAAAAILLACGIPCAAAAQGTDAGVSDAGLPLPGLLAAGGVFDASNPDVVMSVRAGVEVGPAYFGSDQYEVGPDAALVLDYVRLPGGLEFGSSRSVGFIEGFALQGSARYISARDSDDFAEIRGLDDIDWSFELGLGLGYEQRHYRVFADVRYGFIGHNAWTGDIGADGIAYPLDGLTLTLGPRVQLGDDRFADTYFGISADESVASGLSEFDASGGVLGAGVELGARYLFNERWGVEGAARWERLMNDAADSPITAEGSSDQYQVRVGLTRRISLDF